MIFDFPSSYIENSDINELSVLLFLVCEIKKFTLKHQYREIAIKLE